MSPDPDSALPIGTILDGKFRVTRELGRGGMAVVYEAENVDIKKRVAVKVLAAELTHSKVITERFLREARAAAAIRSPYICDVYDVATYDGRPFLVMELLEGQSLYDRLADARQLDVEETLLITKQVCKALARAHGASVVHRDLKPENIFLTKNEDGQTVSKIVDFGLAKFYEAENEGGDKARLTKEGALFGTPAYMSPEQAKAQIDVDHRADLWALACIVYECLTGRTVWNVDQGVAMILAQIAGAPIPRPSRLRADLPEAFDRWFQLALDRDVDRRFQTARDFADSLEKALVAGTTSRGRAPVSTADEGRDVDNMLAGNLDMVTNPRSSASHAASPRSPAAGAAISPSSLPPPAKGKSAGFAVGMLVLASLVVLGGYGAWLYVVHPGSDPFEALRGGRTSEFASADLAPQETEAFALAIGSGQQALSRGDLKAAGQLFVKAFEDSKANAARSFVAHTEVSQGATPGAACTLTGLGHPRPFANAPEPASLPAAARTGAGIVVTWGETAAQPPRLRHAYGTLLDGALRRVLPVVDLTPESQVVQEPMVFSGPRGPLLAFWDTGATAPGAHLRQLDDHGRIAGPPTRLSDSSEKQSYPAAATTADEDIWAVWAERTHPRVYDLKARRLDASLKPLGPPVRLTAYTPTGTGNSIASKARLAMSDGTLLVVYALERNREHHILGLRIALGDPQLAGAGVSRAEGTDAHDRFVGQLVPISTGPGKHNMPDVACADAGCFVAWDDEKAGAHIALVDPGSGEVIWRRQLGEKALRPALGRRGDTVAATWFDNSRVQVALVGRDAVGPASELARVNGYQPPPAIVPGEQEGDWLVAWRDFEAAKHEAFVLRARCP